MKKPYFITYDLNSPGQKYDDVIKTIEEKCARAWCKFWKSSYLITSDLTPDEMIDKIKPYLDGNDSMLIIEVINSKAGWLTQKQWDWINEHIF